MQRLKWLVLFFVFWAIVVKIIPYDFLDLGGDSSQYIIVAESIAGGGGYRMPNYPQEPVCTLYPPVFPLLLSLVVKFFGRNFFLMHFLVAALGYFSLIFLYQLFKKYSSRKLAFFTVFFISLNWTYLAYSAKYILSEVPFIFFSTFSLWILSNYLEKQSYFNFTGVLSVCGLLLVYFCRAIGLVLFFGAIAALYLSYKPGRWAKIVFTAIGFLPFFLAWNIFKVIYRTYVVSQFKLLFVIDPYDSSKGTLFLHPEYFFIRLVKSLNYYSEVIARVVLGNLSTLKPLSGFLILFAVGSVLFGLFKNLRQDKTCPFNYYFIFYLLVVIFWPVWEGVRFILPVVPFIIFYFFAGLKGILSFLKSRIYRVIFPAALSALFLININSSRNFLRNSPPRAMSAALDNFIATHNWIKANLTDKGVILSRKPTVTYFLTNHKAVIYPYTTDPDKIWAELEKNKVRYIIVDEFSQETYRYLPGFILKYRDKLKLLYRVGETGLFEIKL